MKVVVTTPAGSFNRFLVGDTLAAVMRYATVAGGVVDEAKQVVYPIAQVTIRPAKASDR